MRDQNGYDTVRSSTENPNTYTNKIVRNAEEKNRQDKHQKTEQAGASCLSKEHEIQASSRESKKHVH